MRTIILYGELAKRFGKHHRLAVKNAAEAIRALKANFRGFEAYMCGAHLEGMGFRVFMGRGALHEYSDLHNPLAAAETIRIVPTLVGAGAKFGRIAIGALLVVSAVAITIAGLGIPAPITSIMASLGVSMIISGVSQILAKPPEEKTQQEQKNSHIFTGPENTTAQGASVPVCYGQMMVGSAVISVGVQTSG